MRYSSWELGSPLSRRIRELEHQADLLRAEGVGS